MVVELKWEGPFKFQDLWWDKYERYKVDGIYLHLSPDTHPEGPYVSYVGQTYDTKLSHRQCEHYELYSQGRYNVPPWARPCGKVWDACGLREDSRRRSLGIVFELEKLLEVVRDGFNYGTGMQVYLARTPMEILDAREGWTKLARTDRQGAIEEFLKNLESNLIYDIRPWWRFEGLYTAGAANLGCPIPRPRYELLHAGENRWAAHASVQKWSRGGLKVK